MPFSDENFTFVDFGDYTIVSLIWTESFSEVVVEFLKSSFCLE